MLTTDSWLELTLKLNSALAVALLLMMMVTILAWDRVVANSIADSMARISASKDEAAGHHAYESCQSSSPEVNAVKAYAARWSLW